MKITKDLNDWFTLSDLIDIGFIPSECNHNKKYPTYLELGRIKMFFMNFDHWQIIPPGIDFNTHESLDKRTRIYTFRQLIGMIYEWYSPGDYEHLDLPRL